MVQGRDWYRRSRCPHCHHFRRATISTGSTISAISAAQLMFVVNRRPCGAADFPPDCTRQRRPRFAQSKKSNRRGIRGRETKLTEHSLVQAGLVRVAKVEFNDLSSLLRGGLKPPFPHRFVASLNENRIAAYCGGGYDPAVLSDHYL
jgi:hypothetical protein